jgi:hypothetical protein
VPVARIGPVGVHGCTVAHLVAHLRAIRGDASFARAVKDGVRRLNVPAVPRDPWAS